MLHTRMISIHAPRVGRDSNSWSMSVFSNVFQSTRPVWGATIKPFFTVTSITISIHAPRVGRDAMAKELGLIHVISIHAPRVGRDGLGL